MYREAYAHLLMQRGLGIQPGQILCLSIPVQCADFAATLCRAAYDCGASDVQVEWTDDETDWLRLRHAEPQSFDRCPGWVKVRCDEQCALGAAFLKIAAPSSGTFTPEMLARQQKWQRALSRAMESYQLGRSRHEVSWCIACAATPRWAHMVYPDLTPDEGVQRLWSDIYTCTRSDAPDPIAAWDTHTSEIIKRAEALTARRFTAVHLKGPGTDLKVGLPDGAAWGGGAFFVTGNERKTTPNIPTEEIAATPSKYETEGTVRATRPLIYQGSVIEGFSLTFTQGKVVSWRAEKGQDALDALLNTDEGARYLGEVAIVDDDSLISRMGRIFYCTLFDENASCHLALGSGGKNKPENGDPYDVRNRRAVNESSIHVDFMVGSGELDVWGLKEGIKPEAILRQGRWVL